MMKEHKKAIKYYKKLNGNFVTSSGMPFKKESDLSLFYFPGIDGVLEKIQSNPEDQKKYCVHHRTVGLISTRPASFYPLLTARAALLSQLAGVNVIPLLLRYENPTLLPNLLDQLSDNFQMMIGTDLKPVEKDIIRKSYKDRDYPFFFTEQLHAAAVISSLHSAAKMLKKSLKKAKITLEGDDELMGEVLTLLRHEGGENITMIDQKGPIYEKRPNMNKNKNDIVKLMKLKKDSRSREEVLKDTDILISSNSEEIGSSITGLLPDKAVIISLKSHEVTKKPKQSLVSNMAHLPNHITDLHIAVGLASALRDGKKLKDKSLAQAIKGLHSYFKSPKQKQIMPGLLEKKLGQKISNHIR